MKILVANLGSTSFKYRLFDMSNERQLARGGIERIGSAESRCFVEIGGKKQELTAQVPDHAVAVRKCLDQLTDPTDGCLKSASEVSAIGFKAVHGGKFSGVVKVTPEVLAEMEAFGPVAPAHNPPYVRAMRLLAERLPEIPLVAAFETGFHETVPDRNRTYAVPYEWIEKYGIKRWGFHGASHRYIATRAAEIFGRPNLRVISCHLGGSASLCAIKDGKSVATSLGMSPQTGLPHNNRVGDFDPFAMDVLIKRTGRTFDELLVELANKSGLAGLSGTSGDMRDVEEAAAKGDPRGKLAFDVFIGSVRQYLGSYLVELGGADLIVFTGGIGEHGKRVRTEVCQGLEELGIRLDPKLNESAQGEARINAADSRTQIWVLPTNEEIVVARQSRDLLQSKS
jgi:acetate kinase